MGMSPGFKVFTSSFVIFPFFATPLINTITVISVYSWTIIIHGFIDIIRIWIKRGLFKTKDGIPSLHDKISKEFYKEFREKQAEFKKEYNKIAQTLTKGGYKGVTLENELKKQYQTLSKKWINDNIDLVNFNKLYQEYYNKTKDGIDNTIFDADPVKNDIIKTQKLKDWVVKNDIFTSPDRLYYSELVQPKDGIGESDEYKVLKQSSNKALLNAYNLYFKTNKKAFVLGMLSTYKDLNTFLPKIAETRTVKYSPIEKAFWNNFLVKLYSIF